MLKKVMATPVNASLEAQILEQFLEILEIISLTAVQNLISSMPN